MDIINSQKSLDTLVNNTLREMGKAETFSNDNDDVWYNRYWSDIVGEMSTEQIASFLIHLIGDRTNEDEPLSLDQKKFWLEVAERLGPAHAQGMYHAAVFTTRAS